MDIVIGLSEAPDIIWNAKETDNRTQTPFDIVAPAALVSLKIRNHHDSTANHVVQVDVPPLDFLEFRAHLPIEHEIGRELLVRTTVAETMVAIAIRHVEMQRPEGRKAMVQPETVREPNLQIYEWKKAFDRAREYLKPYKPK